MNIVLWILQVLLALAFIAAGLLKSTQPIKRLSAQMDWVNYVPSSLVRVIGVAELLGGLGLILPAVTGILPWLTPLAALGLAVVMVLAAGFHLQRNDKFDQVVPSLVLLVLAVLIIVGRLVVAPL
jgi:uncharacterized membrane protein